ncbi:96_t:CDS:2 [Dentiscutata heterogama]|uniref:96_t:CDS:1 n=1 Tax=Dentiscutata heterogama TaxID=1316150 RepID=A0ACA9KN53_9GLOM|nr:96_t:CDS:2 [Dentiscutata heterogama]
MYSNNNQQSYSESDYNNYETDKLQLNVGYQKSVNAIVVNKFVERHNYSFAPHRKKFALGLYSLLQDVLDTIKVLTQKYKLGAKAQYQKFKKAKHKECLKESSSTQEVFQNLDIETSRSTKQANIETNNNNIKSKLGVQYCGNCYEPEHYTTTCKFSEN